MDQINEKCYWNPDAVDYEIFNRPFYKYHPDYLKKTVMSECKKIYNSKVSIAKRKAEKSIQETDKPQRKSDEKKEFVANSEKGNWQRLYAANASSNYLYFASEKPPTENIPSEAPLCYRFTVESIEKQLEKLQHKYKDLLDQEIKK